MTKQDEDYSIHKKIKEARQAKSRKTTASQASLVKVFDKVASTKDGAAALAYILRLCHPFENPSAMNSLGDSCPNKLHFNLGRQSIWQEIRRNMSRDVLLKVEYPENTTTEEEKQ